MFIYTDLSTEPTCTEIQHNPSENLKSHSGKIHKYNKINIYHFNTYLITKVRYFLDEFL